MLLEDVDPLTDALDGLNVDELKEDQRRAYDIVRWHLEETLAGAPPKPLRMLLYGEGGTGKSRVIQTVTALFRAKGLPHYLLKSSYTGVAASLIDGKTLHVIAKLSINDQGN
ncbi:hypothetical protein EV121DRAFT_194311, partial [Schizophyllum commune]